MPDRDAQWVIGTIVAAVIALSVQLAGTRSDLAEIRADNREMRAEMGEMRADMRRTEEQLRAGMRRAEEQLRAGMRRMEERLRAVEVAVGQVDQRLLTLERVFLPAAPAADPPPAPTPPVG